MVSADETAHLYFAYGANMPSASFLARCPGALAYGPARLPEHRLAFNVHATVRPAPGVSTPGVLWLVTPEHVARLDRFEGYPRYYRREQRVVEVGRGRFEALVYVMNSEGQQPPSPEYLQTLLDGYLEWRLPLPVLRAAVLTTCRHPLAASRSP